MISTHVHSPMQPTIATPSGPRAERLAAPQAPVDSASIGESASRSGLGRKAGVALMAGAALLGAGLMTPTAASARPFGYGYSMPGPGYYHQHRNNDVGSAIAGFAAGAIIGGVVGAIANQASPPVVVVAPPPQPVVVAPAYGDGGFNGVACDGQAHHFDGFGNVADGTGHYRLSTTPYGACVATPATPY